MPPVQRSDPSSAMTVTSTTINSPIVITGIIIIVLIFCGVFSWLGFRLYQKRAASKREYGMGISFLSVKGVVPDSPSPRAKKGTNQVTNGFSRHMIDSTVILPEKALLINSARPRPFTRTAAPVIPSAGALPDFDSWELPQTRKSFMSTKSHRFSTMSGVSSISTSSGTTRKVRQKFEPVLPDELLPVLDERLTVVQSFDDGWCVVGRENSTFVHNAISLFKPQEPRGNIEIGVVPAWCFLKPVKGLRAERPIRSSSLGVTVNMEVPSSRNDMISWSNF